MENKTDKISSNMLHNRMERNFFSLRERVRDVINYSILGDSLVEYREKVKMCNTAFEELWKDIRDMDSLVIHLEYQIRKQKKEE